MPDFSMWGPAESGTRLAEQDQWKNVINSLAVTKTAGEIAMQPSELVLKQTQAKEAQLKLEREQQMQKMMQQAAGQATQGMDAGVLMDQVGTMAVRAGLINEGSKILKDAAEMRQKAASTANSLTLARLHTLQANHAAAQEIAAIIGPAESAEDFAVRNQLYTQQTGRPSPVANLPWSPQLMEYLNRQALTAKETLDLEQRKAHDAEWTRSHAERERHDRATEAVAAARLGLARTREARLEKGGAGKAITFPSKGMIDQAQRLVEQNFPALKDAPEEVRNASASVASKAQALLRSNPALDPDTALQQALNDAIKSGDFQETAASGGIKIPLVGRVGGEPAKTKYLGGIGKTAAAATALPSKASDAVKGRWYRFSDGRVGQWNGKAFVNVQAGGSTRGLSGGNARTSSESEDDQDEED